MQQLNERNTCTPTDAPQVRSDCDSVLNSPSGVRDSVPGLKTSFNNSEVDERSGKSGQGLRVPVLNMRGKPLMPTTPGKARRLVESGKVEVVRRSPFTIRLLYATGEAKQDVTLGIDAGYSHVGFSAVTEGKELICGDMTLRSNMSRLIEKRAAYRRGRRNRLWHREPRFLNRTHAKKKGWLAPSIQHKLDTHLQLIERVKSMLPITRVVVEIATFDPQKMDNPEISGLEYQQGELQGYEVREYLLEKFKRRCVYCGKRNVPLEVEHIIPKSRGGTNRVSNLTLSCRECNQEKGNKTAKEYGHPRVQGKATASLRSVPFMNMVRTRIVDQLGCSSTYGYVTKHDRVALSLPKSHANDAFVIAGGSDQERSPEYSVTQNRRNNRCLQKNRKGYKPSIRRIRHPTQNNDLLRYKGRAYVSRGVHSCGRQTYLIDSNGKKFTVNSKYVELICHGKGLCFRN